MAITIATVRPSTIPQTCRSRGVSSASRPTVSPISRRQKEKTPMIHDVTLRMSDRDFEMLPVTTMEWAGVDWPAQDGRFKPFRPGEPIVWRYRFAYWFEAWGNVILARCFLESLLHEYQILIEEDGEESPFLIVTDYKMASWPDDDDEKGSNKV